MIKCTLALSLLLAGLTLHKVRSGQLWLTIPATSPKWELSCSKDGTNWEPYLIKTGLGPLKGLELQLNTNDTQQLWRLRENYP